MYSIKQNIPPFVKQLIKQLRKQIEQHQKRINSYFDQTDVYLISYPNSGRTWFRVLLGKALCDQYGIDEKLLLDTRNLSQQAGILITEFTHDCSLVDKDNFYYTDQMFFDKARYRGKKIILLIRDPRDVLVSYYFQQVKRDKNYQGTLSDFIRDEKFGINKLLRFNNLWYQNRHLLRDFMVLSYEEIRADTVGCLTKMLTFMGVQDLKVGVVEAAVEFSSFNNMKELEKQNYWQNHNRAQMVQARNTKDEDSYKTRRGKIGGYADYLSAEDIEYINQAIVEQRGPFYTDK